MKKMFLILFCIFFGGLLIIGCSKGTKSGIEDCGISTSLSSLSSEVSYYDIDYEKDAAMVCMGKNLLDNCKKSKVVMEMVGYEQFYEIVGLEGTDCVIKIGFGDESTITIDEVKSFANTDMKCTWNIEDLKSEIGEDLTQKPGEFAMRTYVLLLYDIGFPNTKCTGSMVDEVRIAYE